MLKKLVVPIKMPKMALIAVGGQGERLKQPGHQKCLFKLDNKPVFEHAADTLGACGVEHIVFLTGHFPDQVNDYLKNHPKVTKTGEWQVAYGGVQGEAHAVCSVKHLLCDDFLYTDGNIVVLPEVIPQLIAVAKRNSSAIGVSVLSEDSSIAPTHPRVVLCKESDIIASVLLSPCIVSEEPSFFIVGLHYLRSSCIPFIEALPPNRSLCDFITAAAAVGRQAHGLIIKSPWFALHTKDDIGAWENSPVRKVRYSSCEHHNGIL